MPRGRSVAHVIVGADREGERQFHHASMQGLARNAQHPSPRRLVEVVSRTRHRSRDRRVHRRRPRARRARRQGRRQARRHRYRVESDARRQPSSRERDPEGARHPAPLDRAPAGAGGEGAVPRGAGDHRPGDRERLLLRLLLQAALHAGGPGRDREADGRDREAGPAGATEGNVARRSRRLFSSHRRKIQGRDHRLDPGEGNRSRSTARATGSTCAAGRTCPRPASSRCSS